MAAKTVNVNYNSNSTPPFSFSPNGGNVEVTESGTITFKSDPSFTYSNFTTTPPSPDFSFVVQPNGDMVVTDSDADAGTYNYCVTITVNGHNLSSDPQIINKK